MLALNVNNDKDFNNTDLTLSLVPNSVATVRDASLLDPPTAPPRKPRPTATVERLFSQVGIAFSAKRKSSDADTLDLEDIMFSRINLPYNCATLISQFGCVKILLFTFGSEITGDKNAIREPAHD